MSTEAHLLHERTLSHLHNHNINNSLASSTGGHHNFSFDNSLLIDNNNISLDENNCSSDSHNSSGSSNNSRKPSYVGLSCTVSGYGQFTRYQSPSRKTSPSAIPVSSPPQILDCNELRQMRQPADRDSPPTRGQIDFDVADNASRHHYFPSTQTRKLVMTENGETTVETVTRFYGRSNNREESPCSDSSSSIGSLGSGNGNGGNLVQKQIERLYGGRVHAVRLTSPEPKSPESESDETPKVTGGFFAKRFGIVQQRDYKRRDCDASQSEAESASSHPLDVKQLKVPAVFRLLRPEFREQLKLNSCQVGIPLDQSTAPPKKERIIPIVRENVDKSNLSATPVTTKTVSSHERLIPIVVETNGSSSTDRDTSSLSPIPLKTVSVHTPRSPVKPALPAKPLSPSRPTRSFPASPAAVSTPSGSQPEEQIIVVQVQRTEEVAIPEKVVIDEDGEDKREPDATEQAEAHAEVEADVSEPCSLVTSAEETSNGHHIASSSLLVEEDNEDTEDVDPYEAERFLRSSTSPPCGVRERSLLCPILEEDTESTASGCSLSVTANGGRFAASKEATPNGAPEDGESSHAEADNVLVGEANESVVVVDEFVLTSKVQEQEHDGHYFIKLLENEVFKFEEQICDFEEDLANDGNQIPDEIRDSILAAIGKAKLLISQKFVQFRGLCDKNISQNPEEDPFVPTSEDLAGFWDMVFIQVEHINSLFADLSELRQNKWTPKVVEPVKPNGVAPQPRARKVTPAAKKAGVAGKPGAASNGKQSEAAKARDEARKKMLEARKRMMKEKQQQQQDDGAEVEMFISA